MAVVTGANVTTILDLAGNIIVTENYSYETNGIPDFAVTNTVSNPPTPPNFQNNDPITFTITIAKKTGVIVPVGPITLTDTLGYPLFHNEALTPTTVTGSDTVPTIVYDPVTRLLTITLLTVPAADSSVITVTIPCTIQL